MLHLATEVTRIGILSAAFPLLIFFSLLTVILVWNRHTRSAQKNYILIRVETSVGAVMRPARMNAEDEMIARKIDVMIDDAGLGPLKVLLFQEQPTADLFLEVDDPDVVVPRLRDLLAGLPVTISNIGRPGDIRWHAKLWRHI